MSAVWQYFTKYEDGTFAQCKSCSMLVGRQQGCTTNMWKHLKTCSKSDPSSSGKLSKETTANRFKFKSQSSKLRKYYDSQLHHQSSFACKSCGKIIRAAKGSFFALNQHLKLCKKKLPHIQDLSQTQIGLNFSLDSANLKSVDNKIQSSSASNNIATLNEISEISIHNKFKPLNRFLPKEMNKSFLSTSTPNRKRSKIWRYFEKSVDEKQVAKCKCCSIKIKCTNGNTSNLWHHLKRHISRNELVLPSQQQSVEPNGLISNNNQENLSSTDNSDMDLNVSAMENQLKVVVACDTVTDLGFDKMSKNIALYFIKDLPAYNTLDGEGFTQLLKKFSSESASQSTASFFQDVIYSLKKKSLKILKRFLNESISPISLVVDCWTDDLNQTSFLGIYAYFINPNLSSSNFSCITLSCRTYSVFQLNTAYYIAESVNRWLKNANVFDLSEDSVLYEGSINAETTDTFMPYKTVSYIKTPITISLESFKDYKDIYLFGSLDCIYAKFNLCFSDCITKCICDNDLVPNIFKLIDSLLKFLKTDAAALSRLKTIEKGLGFATSLFLPSRMTESLTLGLKSLHFVTELKNAFLILFETSNINDNFPVLVQSDWASLRLVTDFLLNIQKVLKNHQNASISWFLPSFLEIENIISEFIERNSTIDYWDMIKPFVFYLKVSLNALIDETNDNVQYLVATFLNPG